MNVRFPLPYGIAFLAFAAATPAFPQIPEWAVSHKHVQYPAAEYILGVGQGTGEKADESAKRLAQSDIAMQVRLKVQGEIKNFQQAYGLNANEESYADFKIRSTSIVGEELTDGTIVEKVVDTSTSTTYVLAALNKEKFSNVLAAQLAAEWDRVRSCQHSAAEFLQQGKLTEAIQDLVQARVGVLETLPRQVLHDALARTPYPRIPSLSPSALTSTLREVLSGVRIEKMGGDKQRGKIGENFAEPFIVRVTEAMRNTSVPVVGAEIVFLNASGEQFGAALTDSKGTAACTIKAKGNIGKMLRARLFLPSLGWEFSSSLNSSSAVFDCALLDADVAFSLKVDVRSSRMNDALHSLVINAVTRAGYHIVDMSRFVLRVGFQTSSPSTVDSLDGTFYIVTSDLSVVLIDKDLNRTLGTVASQSKGVATSQDGALEESVHRLKLDGPELVSLLEKAKN